MNAADSTAVVPRSVTSMIVEELRSRIIDGDLPPGQRLNIADLAGSFGVSTIPVREALRVLEAEGWVDMQQNRGATVHRLTPAEVEELFLIRTPLETLAASQVVQHLDSAKAAALEALLEQMDRASERSDLRAWQRLHTRFHLELYESARMPLLRKLIESLRQRMSPYLQIYVADRETRRQAQEEHRAMVRLALQKDVRSLQQAVEEHIRRASEGVTAYLRSQVERT